MSEVETEILAAVRANAVEHPSFYGVLAFHFQHGRLTLIRKEQTTFPQKEKNSTHAQQDR